MATLRVLTGLGRPRLILSLDLPWLRLTQPQSRVEKGDKPLGADFGLVVVVGASALGVTEASCGVGGRRGGGEGMS